MKCVAALGFAIAGVPAFASDVPQPVRFPIRHADPWFVKAMLEGQNPVAPEISVLLNFANPGTSSAQGNAVGQQLFSGGHWVVNPTDNSLWWFPDRKPKR